MDVALIGSPAVLVEVIAQVAAGDAALVGHVPPTPWVGCGLRVVRLVQVPRPLEAPPNKKRVNLTRSTVSVVAWSRSPRRLRAVRSVEPRKGAWNLDQAKDPQAAPDPWRWWDVTDKHGITRRYLGDDFDEFYRTSDERDVHRHLSIGWFLLEESVISGAGPGHWELADTARLGWRRWRPASSPRFRRLCPTTSRGSSSVTSTRRDGHTVEGSVEPT